MKSSSGLSTTANVVLVILLLMLFAAFTFRLFKNGALDRPTPASLLVFFVPVAGFRNGSEYSKPISLTLRSAIGLTGTAIGHGG